MALDGWPIIYPTWGQSVQQAKPIKSEKAMLGIVGPPPTGPTGPKGRFYLNRLLKWNRSFTCSIQFFEKVISCSNRSGISGCDGSNITVSNKFLLVWETTFLLGVAGIVKAGYCTCIQGHALQQNH